MCFHVSVFAGLDVSSEARDGVAAVQREAKELTKLLKQSEQMQT